MPSRVRVFVDFDGTISLEDTTDVVLERFADPAWQKVEADWLAGRIGSRECLQKQIDLVRATPEELDSVCEDVPLDPHFPELVALCRRAEIPVTIVSDGLDLMVRKMLARQGVDLPILANRLEYLGDRRWQLAFPYSGRNCRAQAGHCKCLALTKEPTTMRILIGDGRSDFCAAETSDLVIAKGALVPASVTWPSNSAVASPAPTISVDAAVPPLVTRLVPLPLLTSPLIVSLRPFKSSTCVPVLVLVRITFPKPVPSGI